MASNQQILREYLLSLGFKVDQVSSDKFDKSVNKLDKSVNKLGIAAVAAGGAAIAMVNSFARSMEKLYYSSLKAESSAGNIQALEFAGKQVGVGADTMRAALEGMGRALRTNPGLQGLLESLGVQVQGRDKADVLTDLVTQLNKMPFYVASQYASLFGINPDDLLLLEKGLDQLKQAVEARKQMAKEAGLDADAAARAGREYANTVDRLTERFKIMKDVVTLGLLPAFQAAASWADEVVKKATKTIGDANAGKSGGWAGVGQRLGAQFMRGLGVVNNDVNDWWSQRPGAPKQTQPGGSPGAPKTSGAGLFSNLEQKYGLPTGLLDRMWSKESGRGTNMLSPKGALGHFQFMPDTAKDLGLKDPMDLEQSAQAAARYMSTLMQRYGGDLQKALAAYNWGMGNVDKFSKGKAAMPWETQDYVRTISGAPMQAVQHNTYNITAADPQTTAKAVSKQVSSTWGDLTRNIPGAVDTP